MPENKGKLNPNVPCSNKYQNHVPCTYSYKLICFDDKFSKPFKLYLGQDAVYNFINSMDKESRYWDEVMKEHFNKEFEMTKKMMKNLIAHLNVRFVIWILFIIMLRHGIIVMLL